MAANIFLCSEPASPYLCTFFADTAPEIVTHLIKSHTGIPLYQRLHGEIGLNAFPRPARFVPLEQGGVGLLAPLEQGVVGLPVWLCVPCSLYFVSSLAMMDHSRVDPVHMVETAELCRLHGLVRLLSDIDDKARRRILVVEPEVEPQIPILARQIDVLEAPRPRLGVRFLPPYSEGFALVDLPVGTNSRAALEQIIVAAYVGGEAVDWGHLWELGLPVRYIGPEGPKGKVLRTDQNVAELTEFMVVGECWIGEGQRIAK